MTLQSLGKPYFSKVTFCRHPVRHKLQTGDSVRCPQKKTWQSSTRLLYKSETADTTFSKLCTATMEGSMQRPFQYEKISTTGFQYHLQRV